MDETAVIATTAGPAVAGESAAAGVDENEEGDSSANASSVSSLVERLKSLGQVLEQREVRSYV